MKDFLKTTVLLCIVASQSTAQSTGRSYTYCADRPDEPEYLLNMDMRDSHKRILVQRMYTSKALREVVETGDCSCPTRFPAWESTVEDYLESYSGMVERFEYLEVISQYRRSANEYRKLARPICIEAGNL